MASVSTDITFRISPEDKELIRRGAELEGMTISNFLRVAALDRLRETLRAIEPPASTALPADTFHALMSSIDESDPVSHDVRRKWENARRALASLDLAE